MVAHIQSELPKRIADGVAQFTGRAWLLPKLLEWWQQETERVLLLSGGPGTGKSVIVAWLAGHGPVPADPSAEAQLSYLRGLVSAVHLCQATSRNISPQAFAESIANQLTDSVSGFGDALAAVLAERISIVGHARAGTAACGSRVAGVSIGQVDLSTMGDEQSFNRAFAQPIQALYANGYSKPILLLIDALDEAQTYTEQVTLPTLLSRLADLPRQVRILATTRDEPRVLKFFRGVKVLDLIKDAEPDIDDIQTFARRRLDGLTASAEVERNDFSYRLSTQADGVFLYAAMVLDEMLREPAGALTDLARYRLPNGLSGLYHEFLTRELGRDEQRWANVFRPLLGLISVAQNDGLTTAQISAILKREPDEVGDALRACKQYIDGELPEGPFRPFHKSFSDYLFASHENSDYRIDERQIHQRVATHYYMYVGTTWDECDEYGIRNTLRHALYGEARFIVDSLFTDIRFLLRAEPDSVLEAAPHITKGVPAQIAKIYGQVAHHFRGASAGDRLSYLELAASQGQISLDVGKLSVESIQRRWSVAWTDCQPAAPYIILQGHRGTISAIASGSACDYEYVATGDSLGEIFLWDRITGNRWKALPERRGWEIRVLKGYTVGDKALLLVGDAEGMAECWDVRSERCLWRTNELHWVVSGLTVVEAVHQPLVIIASGGRGGRLTCSDLWTGQTVERLLGNDDTNHERHRSGFYCVTNYTYHAKPFLITGGGDGILRIWDCETGELKWEHVAHVDSIYFVETLMVSGEVFLLTATLGRDIACWRLPRFEKIFETALYHQTNARPIMVTGPFLDKRVVYLIEGNFIVLVDALTGLEISRIEGVHSNWIGALAVDHRGRSAQIMLGGGDRVVYIASEEGLASMLMSHPSPRSLRTVSTPTMISCVTSGASEYLARGFEDGCFRLSDIETGFEAGRSWQLPGAVREAKSMEFQGSTIMACRFDGGVWIWSETSDTHFTVEDSDHGESTAFDIGLRLGRPALAIGTDQGYIGIRYLIPELGHAELVGWHTHRSSNQADPRILRTCIVGLSFVKRGNGSVLASAGFEDHLIKIWSLDDFSLLDVVLDAHRGSITRMIAAKINGGSKLITVSTDCCCKSWNANDLTLDNEYFRYHGFDERNSDSHPNDSEWYADVATGKWGAYEVVVAASRDGSLVFFDAKVGMVLARVSVGYGLWGRRMAFSSSGYIAVAGARGVTALKLANEGNS